MQLASLPVHRPNLWAAHAPRARTRMRERERERERAAGRADGAVKGKGTRRQASGPYICELHACARAKRGRRGDASSSSARLPMQRDGERVVLCWPPHSLAGSRPCVAPSGRRAVGKRWVVIGDATDGFPRERGSGHHWLLAELGVEAGVMAAGGVGLSARRGSKLEDESERRAQGAASAGSSERKEHARQ